MKIIKKLTLLCFIIVFVLGNYTYALGEEKLKIAVMNLKGKNVSAMDASIVSEFLRNDLHKTGKYIVLERGNMEQILTEQAFQQTGCTTQECATKMGKILNVERVVVGSVMKLRKYYLNVRLVDIETGKIEKSAKESCETQDGLESISNKVALVLTGTENSQLSLFEKKQNSWIGAEVKTMNKEITKLLGRKTVIPGVFVNEVQKDSPADNGGIKTGDIIIEIEGKKIEDVSQLKRIKKKASADNLLNIIVVRKNKKINLKVKYETMPIVSDYKPKNGKILKAKDLKNIDDMSNYYAQIVTKKGIIEFMFFVEDAPNTVKNFVTLAKEGFYDGLTFHRVVTGFVIQGGCPKGDGTGGPGYNINAEFNSRKHLDGAVAMARSQDPDSAGSQFYICLGPQAFLDGKYTVFGQVTKGMGVVKTIKMGDVMKKVSILKKK